MNVLVACEVSGVVRDAFRAKGHNAYSCDLLPNTSPYHIACDVLKLLKDRWDLIIAHPPCTYLSVSGNRWYAHRPDLYLPAAEFFMECYNANAPKVCVENPVGRMSRLFRKPDQYIQPYQFGDNASKRTGLWLRGLPCLRGTKYVEPDANGRWSNQTPSGQNKLGPSPERSAERAKTYEGIAAAMAEQWS